MVPPRATPPAKKRVMYMHRQEFVEEIFSSSCFGRFVSEIVYLSSVPRHLPGPLELQ